MKNVGQIRELLRSGSQQDAVPEGDEFDRGTRKGVPICSLDDQADAAVDATS